MIAAAVTALLGALWTTDRAPVEAGSPPTVFLAEGPVAGGAQVFLLRDSELEWFTPGVPESHRRTALPEDTRAFDIADLDGDGLRELIAVTKDGVYRMALDPPGPPTLLFAASSVLGERPGRPAPSALVADFEGAPALALPLGDAFSLFRPDGTVAHSIPFGANAPQRIRYRKPFAVWNIDPPQVGPSTAIEGYADLALESQPELPAGLESVTPAPGGGEAASPAARMADVADAHHANWPWFTVQRSENGTLQALFALEPTTLSDTLIRLRSIPAAAAARPDAERTGPARRYPGRLIPPKTFTDFNGDGYCDAFFWRAPDPALEWTRLSQAASTGLWPVRLALHAFSPERGLFEARPVSVLEIEAPIRWILELRDGAPFRHFIADDLDGDGRGDVALSLSPSTLSAWVSVEGKLPAAPDAVIDFGEPIEELLFAQALRPGAGATLCVRTATALHILAPSAEGD